MAVLIIGSSSQSSIGYAIASECAKAGLRTIITSRRPKFLEKLCADGLEAIFLDYPDHCERLAPLPTIDGVVFCLAKTDVHELQGGLTEITAENFYKTMESNCFALIDLTRRLRPNLTKGASIIALTFFGASTVVPGYGLMGIAKAALEQTIRTLAYELGKYDVRVNGISAGAVATISSRAIRGFSATSKALAENSFLGRAVERNEIAAAAMWLLSKQSAGITGEIVHVNGGIQHAVRFRSAVMEAPA